MPQGTVPVTRIGVRLLGPPGIERDGASVAVDTRKALALLAYLAVTGRPQPRESLVELLWPEGEPAKARSALRRTLSVLNKALDRTGLAIDRRQVRLIPEEIDIDLYAFRRLVRSCDGHGHPPAAGCSDCVEPLAAASELYRGDLLAGFALRDSPEFDDWHLAQAEHIRREYARCLERLVACLGDDGRLEAAIDVAKRWLELDGLHEPAHRRLMELYAASGDRRAALRQYSECVAVLDRELGVAPVAETSELHEAIREGRGVPDQDTGAVPVVQAEDDVLPLVEREDDLQTLEHLYASIGPDGALAVIEGEAGIGKTRLAEELIGRVEAEGATVVRTRCHPGEAGLAYGPVSEAVRAILARSTVDDEVRAEVSRLLPGARRPSSTVRGAAARTRFLEAILTVFEGVAGPAPGVVFVDDAHWIDDASATVFSYVARRLHGRPLLILLAARREGSSPIVGRLLGSGTSVSLGRLSRTGVARLASSSGAVGEDVIDRLHEESEGVPFFVAQYLAGLRRGEWTMPAAARDAVASRIAALGDVASQLLAAAAVLGRAFDADVLRAASGRGEEETVGALEELVAQGMVSALADGTYDFAHHKIREVVAATTTPARARLLHRRVARALRRRVRRHRGLWALVAHHLREAGDIDDAARAFERAADHARRLFANGEALSLYQDALACSHPDEARLHETVGDLLTLEGSYRDAVASYETAAALGAEAWSIAHKLGTVHMRLGSFRSAESYLAEAQADAPTDAVARIEADRAVTAHRSGRPDEASALARSALDHAERAADERSMAVAHNILGMLVSSDGDVAAARKHLERSLELARRIGDPGARAAALNNLALAHRAEGDLREAQHCAERALDLCARMGDRHREGAVHSNLADILRDRGEHDTANEHVRRSAAIFADVGGRGELQPEIWKLVEW